MIKVSVLMLLLSVALASSGQTAYMPNMQQRMLSQKAYDQIHLKKYKEAALTYDSLFTLSKGQGTVSDNYNSACAYAVTGDKAKALLHLRDAVFINKWTNIGLIMSDPDLKLVRSDESWEELIHQVKVNIAEKAAGK